jgi:hypothetical protein
MVLSQLQQLSGNLNYFIDLLVVYTWPASIGLGLYKIYIHEEEGFVLIVRS